MTRIIQRYTITRGKLLIVMVGMVSALLIIAACTGASATATPAPTATTEPTSTSPSAPEVTPGPGGSVQTPEQPSESVIVRDVTGSGQQPVPGVEARTREVTSTTEQASSSSASSTIQVGTSQQGGISVTGRGEVTTNPDLAIVNAGVEAKAKTVQEARTQAAQAMNQMVQVLNDRGIQSGDIQTRFFNISPEYVFNRTKEQQELVGYRVNNQVSVKIRDIGSVGLIIDELAAAGGDLVRIQGVSFTVEDTEALEFQAREKAVANLMAKAQQFADLTGVQLGRPIFLSESGGFAPRLETFGVRALAPAAAAPTPISGGELTVTIVVQGTFSIIE